MSLTQIRAQVDAALEQIGTRLGVSLKTSAGHYGGGGGTFGDLKIKILVLNDDGTTHDPASDAFREHAELFDLKPDWLGKSFEKDGATYTITGLNMRAQKMPVLARRADGRSWKFAVATVKALMATPVR